MVTRDPFRPRPKRLRRRPLSSSWCLAAPLLSPRALGQGGDPRCPCSPVGALGGWPERVAPAAGGARTGGLFGVGCRPHFRELPPGVTALSDRALQCTNGSPQRPWCNSSWCFVNPQNCTLPNAFLTEPPLFYSFQTCGYLDTFTPEVASTELAGSTLQVVYLTNSGGYLGAQCPANRQSCIGPTADFWGALLATSRAELKTAHRFAETNWVDGEVPFPSTVVRQFREDLPTSRSTFDACVYAAGMGFVDVCVGATTINSARVKVATMIEFYQIDVWLVVPQRFSPDTFWEMLGRAWQPFSPGVWLAIAILVGAAGLLTMLHERCAQPRAMMRRRDAEDYLRVGGMLVHTLYDSWMAFWSGGRLTTEPSTSGARITMMGLALFVLMTTTAYTANLATVLLLRAQTTSEIKNVKDVISRDYKVCVESSQSDILAIKVGIQPKNIVPLISRSDLLPSIGTGACDVAAMRMEDVLVDRSRGRFCSLGAVEQLFWVPQGVAVSNKAARSMQWFQQQLAQEGLWGNLEMKSRPKDNCPRAQAANTSQMDVSAMAGPMAVAAVFFLIGVLVHAAELMVRCWARRIAIAKGLRFSTRSSGAGAFAFAGVACETAKVSTVLSSMEEGAGTQDFKGAPEELKALRAELRAQDVRLQAQTAILQSIDTHLKEMRERPALDSQSPPPNFIIGKLSL